MVYQTSQASKQGDIRKSPQNQDLSTRTDVSKGTLRQRQAPQASQCHGAH